MPEIRQGQTWVYRTYAAYNRKYFNNKLPKNVDILVKERALSFHGYTFCDRDGHFFICLGAGCVTSECLCHSTLLHEMAHIATWNSRKHHGPEWVKEMRRLSRVGALDRWF